MVEDGTYPSLCRVCANTCPILVTVEDGRAVTVTGDPDGPAHHGYSCVKGRALPEFHNTEQRLLHVVNSSHNHAVTNRGRPYNPAFVHPDDLDELGFAAGDLLEISSAHGAIPAVVAPDTSVRRGTVSMSHAFGGGPESDDEVTSIGSPTNRLPAVDRVYDRYSGQPLMSNIPVAIRPLVTSR